MSMHEIQEGLGGTGKFGEGFVALGLLGGIGGTILILMGVFMSWPQWNDGPSVYTDSLTSGMLFLMMGLGFIVFGVMAMMSGWARHHPGFDEHGLKPTEAQLDE